MSNNPKNMSVITAWLCVFFGLMPVHLLVLVVLDTELPFAIRALSFVASAALAVFLYKPYIVAIRAICEWPYTATSSTINRQQGASQGAPSAQNHNK